MQYTAKYFEFQKKLPIVRVRNIFKKFKKKSVCFGEYPEFYRKIPEKVIYINIIYVP